MNTREWLSVAPFHRASMHVRKRAKCADGMTISIQASEGHYCRPRINFALAYLAVEVGFPSEEPPSSWDEYRDGPASDVWGYVPVELVDAWLAEHGGIVGPKETEESGR